MRHTFADLELDASDIARRIDALAELARAQYVDNLEFMRLLEKIRYWWDLARAQGLLIQVDSILQKRGVDEMNIAINKINKIGQ